LHDKLTNSAYNLLDRELNTVIKNKIKFKIEHDVRKKDLISKNYSQLTIFCQEAYSLFSPKIFLVKLQIKTSHLQTSLLVSRKISICSNF